MDSIGYGGGVERLDLWPVGAARRQEGREPGKFSPNIALQYVHQSTLPSSAE